MPSNGEPDHRLFDPAAVAPDTRAFMERFDQAMRGVPTAVNTPITALREARASGKAALPIVRLPNGIGDTIPGPAGPIALRIFKPAKTRGAFLHFHGGGFVMGAPDQFDALLNRVAEDTGLTVISAGYRLAPEHPFPAAPDDAIVSARWFLQQADAGAFGGGGVDHRRGVRRRVPCGDDAASLAGCWCVAAVRCGAVDVGRL